MLTIENLSAHYGTAQALFDLSLTVEQGSTAALVGANGAGKSTLLKCLMGLLKPSAGRILLDGSDITGSSPAQRVRQGLVLSPEGREVFPHLPVHENLTLGACLLYTSPSPRDRTRSRMPSSA